MDASCRHCRYTCLVFPLHKEYLIRERAFSWDASFEELLHAEVVPLKDHCSTKPSSATVTSKNATTTGTTPRKYNRTAPYTKQIKAEPKRLFDPRDFHIPEHPILKLDAKQDFANVKLENGSGITTVLPVFQHYETIFSHGSGNVTRIGAYTKEERRRIIERFRAKKQRRVWSKQIKYDCRKRLADTRPRIKGRFVSRKRNPSIDKQDNNSDMDEMECIDLCEVLHDDEDCTVTSMESIMSRLR